MMLLKSGDLIEDSDGTRIVFLGIEQNAFYATFPFYIESNRKFVQIFNVTPYLQNRSNFRITEYMPYDNMRIKMQLMGKQILYRQVLYNHFDYVEVPLYTWKEAKNTKGLRPVTETNRKNTQLYMPNKRINDKVETGKALENFDDDCPIENIHLRVGDIVETPDVMPFYAPHLRVVILTKPEIYVVPLSASLKIQSSLRKYFCKVGHLNKKIVEQRFVDCINRAL